MKRMKSICYASVIIILSVIIMFQYKEMIKIKSQQGQIVMSDIIWVQFQLKSVSDNLSSTETPRKEDITRAMAVFNGCTILLTDVMSGPMLSEYTNMIGLDLSNMASNINNIDKLSDYKKTAVNKAKIFETELGYIQNKCGNNYIMYYKLREANNSIMKKVDNDLINYLNENNIH